MQTHRHQADILIIGGGVCGLNAALTAREQGRSVIVMDKAVIERSGHIAGGIDHFLAYMNTGAEWDTREAYLEFTGKSARGVTNIDVVDSVYCQELPHALKRFEEINCTLRQPDGTYYRTKSYGQPGPWYTDNSMFSAFGRTSFPHRGGAAVETSESFWPVVGLRAAVPASGRLQHAR